MEDQSITLLGIRAERVQTGFGFSVTLSIAGRKATFPVGPVDLVSYRDFQKVAAIETGQVFISPECEGALPGREDRVWARITQKMLRNPVQN